MLKKLYHCVSAVLILTLAVNLSPRLTQQRAPDPDKVEQPVLVTAGTLLSPSLSDGAKKLNESKKKLIPVDYLPELQAIKLKTVWTEKPTGSYKQPLPTVKFSPHFTAGEFTKNGSRKLPNWEQEQKCRQLANALESLRAYYGGPISVTSGYRDAATNKAIGGVPRSQHVYGCAVDVVIKDAQGKVVNHQKVYKDWFPVWIKLGGIGNYGTSRKINHFDLREIPATWYWKSVDGKEAKPDWLIETDLAHKHSDDCQH